MLRKHVNNNDIALEVIKAFFVPQKKVWKLKVRWWNIGVAHPPWSMGITEKLEIDDRVWKLDWKKYEWRPINREYIKEVIREQNTAPQTTVD